MDIISLFTAQKICMNDNMRARIEELLSTIEKYGGGPSFVSLGRGLHDHSSPDWVVETTINSSPIRLVIEAKRAAFPRDVREAVWQLKHHISSFHSESKEFVPLIVAETISPGARELLQKERIGYFDESGSFFLPTENAFILIEKPRSKKHTRSLNNLFTGSRVLALHAVWLLKDEWFGVHEIAERARVSPATVSQTLIALEKREWVVSRGAGPTKERRLSNSRALLDAWENYQTSTKPKSVRHYYARPSEVNDMLYNLDRSCHKHNIPYELTGVVAAQIYTPHLSHVSQAVCRLPALSALEEVLEDIDARPVGEGWNFGVIETNATYQFPFRQRINGLWMADPLQTYLDLLQTGGRARDMAKHLRSERLATQ